MDNTTPNTNNFLNWVEIKNFKSIKDLRLDCKRVNVFIGKPNVGKSNILEGLGLLGSQGNFTGGQFFEGILRYKSIRNFFYDNNNELPISIESNNRKVGLELAQSDAYIEVMSNESNKPIYNFHSNGKGNIYRINEEGKILVTAFKDQLKPSPLMKYDFTNLVVFSNTYGSVLIPPNGPNLYSVIRRNDNLLDEFAKLFIDQRLEFVLYDEKQEFILQKKYGSFVIQYPYFSIADTFRRFMFYITAIESNKNSVIVFEEPEVHSFPPYTQEMAYRMIYDEDNQYFISTHSPYMLQPFIEKMDFKDLNVFITYYKDYQTHVRALTEEELTDILDYSTNVFFNLRKFEPNA